MTRHHPLYLLVVIVAAMVLEWVLAKRLNKTLKRVHIKNDVEDHPKSRRNRLH